MFGISFGELCIVLLIVIFCVEPKDLPRIYLYLKGLWIQLSSVKNDIMDELNKLDEEVTKNHKKEDNIEYHYLDPKD